MALASLSAIPPFNANSVKGYAPEKIEYGMERYQNETRRLYRAMDTQLKESSSGYLVGDKATIADFSCWGWVSSHRGLPCSLVRQCPEARMLVCKAKQRSSGLC
jgi:glutathione S-transferase